MDIPITRVDTSRRSTLPENDLDLGFGKYFSDHMFLLNYAADAGWHDPRIVPYGPLSLSPAAMVLHYGQEAFEGLKAYHGVDGKVRLFRHDKNLARMNASARRLCMPELDDELVAEGMKKVVMLDHEWIPRTHGCALYIRPTYIATTPFLGVRPADDYLFYVMLSPVAAYYPEGFNPVKIYVSDTYVRAVEGGVGEAKTGGNYAASLRGQLEAKRKGYSQVLWLDAKERRYIEEVGTMNIFFVIGDEVITSPLTGSILPGVTRDSVLHLLRDWGYNVTERRLDIAEVVNAADQGTLKEVFGTGTAAIISPVSHVCYRDQVKKVADGATGELSDKLYKAILDIQYGAAEDKYNWMEIIG